MTPADQWAKDRATTRLEIEKWHPTEMYQCVTIWMQHVEDGWFAKIEDESRKLSIISGPWQTENDAKHELINGIERIVIGVEGE